MTAGYYKSESSFYDYFFHLNKKISQVPKLKLLTLNKRCYVWR